MRSLTLLICISIGLLLGSCVSKSTTTLTTQPSYPSPNSSPTIIKGGYPSPEIHATQAGGGYPGPNEPITITWEIAKQLILEGGVLTIEQHPDLSVILTLKDARIFQSIEPTFDEVVRLKEQCGEKCTNTEVINK
jgi:hypothetical protein